MIHVNMFSLNQNSKLILKCPSNFSYMTKKNKVHSCYFPL